MAKVKKKDKPKNKQSPTIYDIAEALKISASTVSRALNDSPEISESTKIAVKKIATQINYQPNSIAYSLRTKKTKTIGIIIPELVNQFFFKVISGIENVAYEKGYKVIICHSNENYEREVMSVNALLSSRVDGVIISVSSNSKNFEHLKALQNKGIEIVFFDRAADGIHASKVIVDDINGAFQAVNHLIKKGYQNIVHLKGPENLNISKYREEGYIKALKFHGLKVKRSNVISCELEKEHIRNKISQLLKSENLPDAIFAFNDRIAMEAISLIKELGLRIPKDIAVVGFSNEPGSVLVEPNITTINQPGEEIGKRAAEILLNHLKGEKKIIEEVLPVNLIIREST